MGFSENTDGALRGWMRATIIVLIALAGLALLMFAPELNANPLLNIQPG